MKRKMILFCLSASLLTLGCLASCQQTVNEEDENQDKNPDDNPSDIGGDEEEGDKEFTGTLFQPPKLPDGEKGIVIRYNRKDADYENWCLWIWEVNGSEGQIYNFSNVDDFGGVFYINLSNWSDDVLTNGLGIITRKATSWDGQSADMILDFSNFTIDENGYYNVFISQGEDTLFNNPNLEFEDEITMASFLTESRIRIETTNTIDTCKIYENEELLYSGENINKTNVVYDFKDKAPSITSSYRVEVTFIETGKLLTAEISKRGLYNSDLFNNEYYYDGKLGAIYSETETVFKVWSPLSEKISLRIYDNGTPTSVSKTLGSDEFTEYEMKKGEKGVFEYTLSGNNEGKYYTYVVTNSKFKNKEIVDPYAKSTGVNGLRGMIVDFSKTNPDGWEKDKSLPYSRTELTIYETHVADVTSSETLGGNKENAKKFAGLYETGTTYTEDDKTVKTGFDHIKELGVNAVQLLPIFDQANDELATDDTAFNWGYNPLNYNSLDGIYSSNPYDGYQKIKEFKTLVKAYHDAGINIIMDVVYNHVNGAEGSNFDVLMPEYFFRYDAKGKYSNGSACGNETASENLMMRKFMVDSTEFWAKEYHLGGFRFDLMGCHDLETMNAIVKNLKAYDENIFVHGEPWTGGTTTLSSSDQASQSNINKFEGFGAFNDKIRDALIKGGLSAVSDLGWATNIENVNGADEINIMSGIKGNTGSLSNDPLKATNYVTCHDNYTLYDRISAAYGEDSVLTDAKIADMATLANSIVFTSQGTSFMLAGEEMLRTKGGDGNSYASGYEVNALDYSRLIDFENVYNNYQSLIDLKKNLSALHYTTAKDIEANLSFDTSRNGVIDYTIKSDEGTYRFLHINPSLDKVELGDLSNCEVILDTKNNESSLDNFVALSSESIVLKLKA